MKVATPSTVRLHQAAAKTPGSEYAFWAGPLTAAPNLTPRQLEVLALLCEGLPNKLICRRLNIAAGTVKVHVGCILRQLGAVSRLQAVVIARGCGLPALLDSRAAGEAHPEADVVAH